MQDVFRRKHLFAPDEAGKFTASLISQCQGTDRDTEQRSDVSAHHTAQNTEAHGALINDAWLLLVLATLVMREEGDVLANCRCRHVDDV